MSETPWQQIQNKLRQPHESEDEVLKNWLNEDSANSSLMDDLTVIYSISGNVPETFTPETGKAWQKIVNRISGRKIKIGFNRILIRVAASILLVALGVGGSWLIQKQEDKNSYTEVFSPFGHKTMVILPDSSTVWLNGNSRIKYSAHFQESRHVELTGEALFKVTKNPDKLFTVKSSNLQVEVYGTTFNVKAYPEDILSEVALVEGSVGLYHNQIMLKKMIPGEVITYNSEENKFTSKKGNIHQITSWRADELIIENQTIEDVAKYLERWYGVEIMLDNSLKRNLRLSFKVKTESLLELLSIIDHITPVTYEIDGKKVKIAQRTTNKS